MYLSKEQEIDPDNALKNLINVIDNDFGLINGFTRKKQYYDEPKFWYYSAILNNHFSSNQGRHFYSLASGVSAFDEKLAVLRCLGEAMERYSNFVYLKKYSIVTDGIEHLGDKVIDPRLFSGFSKIQLKNPAFKKYRITNSSVFRWSECKSLINGKIFLVPSQFIFLSYPYLKNESIIYPAISTGVAGGSCLSAALVRGIYEIIERDSYMIYYLNKIPGSKIALKNLDDYRVKKLLEMAKRYNLEIISINITTDLGIPAVASIVLCRDGIGKAVSVGLKSNLNIIEAIIGSIEEAFHTRDWIRTEYEKEPKTLSIKDLVKDSSVKNRGLFWYPTYNIKNLDFWISSKNTSKLNIKNKKITTGQELEQLLKKISGLGYQIYYKDITHESFKNFPYFVVKVIVPEMQPVYLNERLPLLGGDRLYNVPVKLGFNKKSESKLNKYPHPFL